MPVDSEGAEVVSGAAMARWAVDAMNRPAPAGDASAPARSQPQRRVEDAIEVLQQVAAERER